jgi:acyl CoA:acetate/3-ketoacid CoA transferase beta subunit
VATNLGLFAPHDDGFIAREIASGISLDEVQAVTGCKVT